MQIILSLFYIINVFEQFFVYFQVITNKLCEKYIKGAHHKSYPLPLFTSGSRVLDRSLQFLTLGMGIAALNHSVILVI